MTTEWKDITDPEELFRLNRDGWIRQPHLDLEGEVPEL